MRNTHAIPGATSRPALNHREERHVRDLLRDMDEERTQPKAQRQSWPPAEDRWPDDDTNQAVPRIRAGATQRPAQSHAR